jgi:thioredoxin reductase
MDYDCIVVGAGPAGLSAALTLGRARRRTLVLDSGQPRNHAARHMHGVLGHDGLPPAELRAKGVEELSRYGIEVRAEEVSDAEALRARAHTLILATGLLDRTPAVPGFDALYGITAHTCPYCDGWEHRDKRLAVYATGEAAAHMGPLLRQWSDDVIVFDPADVTRLHHDGDGHLTHVELSDGERVARDALFFRVAVEPRTQLAQALGCELDEQGFIVAGEDRMTTVDGVYAVGNCVDQMLNVPMAIADGARAGVAVNVRLLASAPLPRAA